MTTAPRLVVLRHPAVPSALRAALAWVGWAVVFLCCLPFERLPEPLDRRAMRERGPESARWTDDQPR